MDIRNRNALARHWGVKGGMSLVDQLLFSGSNFLLNILLARWLEPAQYGAFTLAYAGFLFLGTLHNALFTEPMLVFGSGAYAGRFRQYLGLLIAGHLLLVVPLGLLLWGAASAFGRLYSREVQQAFWGFALASPLILWLWLVRRACYVRLQPGRAALGGALYSVLLLGSVFLLRSAQRLSQGAAGIAMGLCALPTIIYLILLLQPRIFGQPRLDAAGVAADHWRYGRWALGTAALSWLPANVYYALLPLWAGLEDVAGLRVLTNLAVPVLNIISALSFLLLPMLGRHRREDPRRLLGTMKVFLALFAGGSTLYLGVVVLFRNQLLQLLYGGKYTALANLVPLACLLPYLFGFTTVMGAALRAMERPDRIFWCYAGSNLAALVFGVLMARAWGVRGALAGQLLSASITGVLMLLFFRAVYRQMAGPPPGARRDTLRWLDRVLVEGEQAQFSAGPPPAARRPPLWAWLGLRDGRALLLPLDSRAVGSGALGLYRPRLPGARILKALLLLGLRTGLARLLLAKVRIDLRREAPPTDRSDVFLLDYLREVLGRGELLFGVYAGAAGAVRKPVVAILSPEGRQIGFAKIGWNRQTCALVENERQTLEHLAAHPLPSGRFPTVRHFSRWHGRCVLITDPLPLPDGRGAGRAGRKLLGQFLSEVAGLGKSRLAFGKSGFYARLLRRRETLERVLPAGHPPVLSAAIGRLSAELGPEEIPWVWRLGDFSPWNLGIDRRRRSISTIDVEYAERDSIPGWDIFHYVSQAAGRNLPALDVAAAVRHGWLGYFEALGVDPLLIPLLYAAYLCDLYTLWAELWHESGQPISAGAAEILDRLIQLLGGLLQRREPERARGR